MQKWAQTGIRGEALGQERRQNWEWEGGTRVWHLAVSFKVWQKPLKMVSPAGRALGQDSFWLKCVQRRLGEYARGIPLPSCIQWNSAPTEMLGVKFYFLEVKLSPSRDPWCWDVALYWPWVSQSHKYHKPCVDPQDFPGERLWSAQICYGHPYKLPFWSLLTERPESLPCWSLKSLSCPN